MSSATEQARFRNSQQDGVGADALRASEFRGGIRSGRIQTRFRAEPHTHLAAERHRVAGKHRSACRARQKRQQKSDRTLTDNEDDLAASHTGLSNCLQAGVHRFHEDGFLKSDFVRYSNTPRFEIRHHADVLREAAAVRLKPGSHADLFVLRTLRKQLTIAVKARVAWNVMKADHTVTNGPPLDTRSSLSYLHRFPCDTIKIDHSLVRDSGLNGRPPSF